MLNAMNGTENNLVEVRKLKNYKVTARDPKVRFTSLKTNHENPNYELFFFCNRTSSTMQTFSTGELPMFFFSKTINVR